MPTMIDEHKKFWNLISDAKMIGIIFNYSWSGDAVASALALAMVIGERGTSVEVLAQANDSPHPLSFLPGFQNIKSNISTNSEYVIKVKLDNTELKEVKISESNEGVQFIIKLNKGEIDTNNISVKNTNWPYDLIITIGCPNKDAVGNFTDEQAAQIHKSALINIDNHYSNENHGHLNIVDIQSSAVSEIIYRLINSVSQEINPAIATCLLAGLISQTKNFKTPIVSPETLNIASDLIRAGADRNKIVDSLYRNRKITLMKLWGIILTELRTASNKRILWSHISTDEWQAKNATTDDLKILCEELLSEISECILVIIYIGDSHKTETYLYSLKNIDSLYIGRSYGATGNRKIASFKIDKPIIDAVTETLPAIEERLNKIIDN